mmetsp:Transcript_19436/g.50446  ORF Transcript_19436/g.50446 Transcript_19436/m.50446 type:complete len:86 (+) Transcript_19436:376-633(+)
MILPWITLPANTFCYNDSNIRASYKGPSLTKFFKVPIYTHHEKYKFCSSLPDFSNSRRGTTNEQHVHSGLLFCFLFFLFSSTPPR